ncbi:MAG TPA: sortase [Candidatus Dormibacteraeota bacterium]|nr:sortase [Candidatus Dormibacteraeota bacterium]
MATLFSALRNRLLPAVLTATGVSLIAAGLLTYSAPVEAAPAPSDSPEIVAVSPTPTIPLPSFPPSGSTSPSPSAPADRVATRVVVPALKIDLPIVKPVGGSNTYPQCNVAMYIKELHQPGQGGATYLYAHARDGMFGPIYHLATEVRKPQKMLNMIVQVYTSDDQVFEYYVTQVLLHQTSLNAALDATTEELWLQTSEGPKGTVGKTQVRAELLTVGPANHADAHPTPHPVNCG